MKPIEGIYSRWVKRHGEKIVFTGRGNAGGMRKMSRRFNTAVSALSKGGKEVPVALCRCRVIPSERLNALPPRVP